MSFVVIGIVLFFGIVQGLKPSPWSHGRLAGRKEFPFILGLFNTEERLVICTAALVTTKKAIMTGSCFRDPNDITRDRFKTDDGYRYYSMIGSSADINSTDGFSVNPVVKHWYHCHFRFPNNRSMAYHDTGTVLMKHPHDGGVPMKIPAPSTEGVKKVWNRLRIKGQMCKQAAWPTGRKDRKDANRLHVIYTIPMSLQQCKQKLRDPILHRIGYVCGKTSKPETGVCPVDMHGSILVCDGEVYGFKTSGLYSVCSHSYFVLVGDSVKPLGLENNFSPKSSSHTIKADIRIALLLTFLSKIKLYF